MKTYKTKGIIDENHRLTLDIPCDMDTGEVEIVLVVDEKSKLKKGNNKGLLDVKPVHCGKILSETLSREEIYGEYR